MEHHSCIYEWNISNYNQQIPATYVVYIRICLKSIRTFPQVEAIPAWGSADNKGYGSYGAPPGASWRYQDADLTQNNQEQIETY